ncbi:tumor necrosis factor receptor superfamily member 14-like [Notolabrus celidotus]|uniref:tumor necrosis factor receptor superfamily member 14-like n=1 Tax=Notolabrus celidotus TaxID=1203425 RepID=UPI00148FBA1F|nr:tumor necrosis factor receptor superfamily member 14-like [Notolabrus celidotus]
MMSAQRTSKMILQTKLCSLLMIIIIKISTGQTLTCHRTEYQIGKECCLMCGKGEHVKTDCDEDKSTSCKPCSEGTFMNKLNGLKSCFPCSNCDEGSGLRINTSCTRTLDSVREPLEGFFCTQSAEHGCLTAQRHRSCRPGQYISQRGTSLTDAVCSPCSAGTFSNGTFPSCREHTQCESLNKQLLRPGTKSDDAECGELSPEKNTVIIGVVVFVVVFVVVVGLIVAARLYHRKKINRCLNRGKRSKTENGHMEQENLNKRRPVEVNQDRTEDQIVMAHI